jgi:probable HAF family extracellular repeat protein
MGNWISCPFRPRRLRHGTILFVVLAVGLSAPVTAQTYQVIDLGTLGGTRSYGSAINSSGAIVGESTTAGDGLPHAFLWDRTIHDLGTVAGPYSSARGISDNGLITGWGSSSNGPTHAILYDGAMHDLGTPNGPSDFSYGQAVNVSGQVAVDGFAAGIPQGFLYDGTWHPLGTLGGSASHVHAINNAGRIVGDAYVAGNYQRAALYDGAWHELGTLGGLRSAAVGISANGLVTGESQIRGSAIGVEHAFLYDGTMHDLGTLGGTSFSVGNAVNSSGVVTGSSDIDSTGKAHAFLYSAATGMLDLNSLINPSSGWVLGAGNGINDAGQITGAGTKNGQSHAFLLTPLPEPGSLTLLAAMLGLTAARRRRMPME